MDIPAATILLVEDDRSTRTFLADNLAADGFEMLEAESLGDAKSILATAFPDLVVIDLGLPDGDGLELVRHVRAGDHGAGSTNPDTPLLILTGRGSSIDLLRGFERGCDDYVLKPFAYPELLARIAALLRRTQRRPGTGRVRVGPLDIDPMARRVTLHGEPVHLSKKEFALVRTLAADPSRVFTREELLRGVWGFRTLGATRTLDSHACRLRKKLTARGDQFVVNVWGIGYRLVDG